MSGHSSLHGILETLQQRGARLTAARVAVLQYLCTNAKPVSVRALEHALPAFNIVTLYRVLEYLINQNIVRLVMQSHQEQYFELADPYHRHHDHTVCVVCGKVTDLRCRLTMPTRKDFIPQTHVVTVYGRCKQHQV